MLCVSNEQCMKEEKIPPASVDYASAVSNTSGTGKLSFGPWIHFQAFFISQPFVNASCFPERLFISMKSISF